MKTTAILLTETGSDSDFVRLGACLNTETDGKTLSLDNNIATGIIKKIKIEDGLYMLVGDCSVTAPAVLYYTADSLAHQKIFNLAFTIDPEGFTYINQSREDHTLPRGANTFFINNSSSAVFNLTPGVNLRFIYFSMTNEWLTAQFKQVHGDFIEIFEQYTSKMQYPFFSTCPSHEYIIVNEIFERAMNDAGTTLFTEARILLLISSFFERMFASSEIVTRHFEYFQKILQAELILAKHIESTLPSLPVIAKSVGLSESGLKRYFKVVYGKNVYEYYLDKKMEFAKRILVDNNKNVNEIASQLGYENVSNFIEVFKKHFGYLPGAIRKSTRS